MASINGLVARNIGDTESIRSEIINGNTTTTDLLNIGNLYKDISILNGGAGAGSKRKYKSKKNKRTKTNKKGYKKRGYKKRTRKH
jgi:hypothetical protein